MRDVPRWLMPALREIDDAMLAWLAGPAESRDEALAEAVLRAFQYARAVVGDRVPDRAPSPSRRPGGGWRGESARCGPQ
jgi:hypothetical protein